MDYQIKKMDLMDMGDDTVICHCISQDCMMGAGVVVPIKKKYTGVQDACMAYTEERSASGRSSVGKAFRYSCEAGTVYNLFSKELVSQRAGEGIFRAQYHAQLRSCLEDMRDQMLSGGEKKLAMPKIACGIDRCRWEDIEPIIQDVFRDTDMSVTVCVL